jgi:hypothetical protein
MDLLRDIVVLPARGERRARARPARWVGVRKARYLTAGLPTADVTI